MRRNEILEATLTQENLRQSLPDRYAQVPQKPLKNHVIDLIEFMEKRGAIAKSDPMIEFHHRNACVRIIGAFTADANARGSNLTTEKLEQFVVGYKMEFVPPDLELNIVSVDGRDYLKQHCDQYVDAFFGKT